MLEMWIGVKLWIVLKIKNINVIILKGFRKFF